MNGQETATFINQFGDLITFVILLLVGFTVGTILEKMHFASLKKREKKMLAMEVSTVWDEALDGMPAVEKMFFVTGCCVVSQDYFKKVLAALKTIFGGRLGSYETLIDRGRREATLRMKEAAKKVGCDLIIGARLETAPIGDKTGQGVGCIEVIAYGTAVKLSK